MIHLLHRGSVECLFLVWSANRFILDHAEVMIWQKLHPRFRDVCVDKCGGAADIVLVIINAADNRDADYNLSGQMLQPLFSRIFSLGMPVYF